MLQATITNQYDLWSGIYDLTFSSFVVKRQRLAIQQLGLQGGDRVLDVGVGTGTSLSLYPRDVHVVGLDLSAGMLRKAQRKLVGEEVEARVSLVQADALMPPFADQSFDHMLMTHVVNVVPDTGRLMAWAERLIKPGGRIVIVTHFQSPSPAISLLQKAVNPVCRRLGWRTDLSVAAILDQCSLRLSHQFKMQLLDLWHVVVLTHRPPLAAGA